MSRIILDFSEDEAALVIMLIEQRALTKRLPGTWGKLLKQIREQVERQKNGQFFQCSACREEVS